MNMMDFVGQTLGQYRIEAPLDAGGMGQVFRGVHLYLHRPAAIKIMWPHLAANATFRARFLQEARAAATLKHPNIIDIYEFGEQNGHLYMVMELVTGGSLRTLLQQQSTQPHPLALGLDLIRQAAEGLAVAHGQGIIHRDIKPDNLLLQRLNEPGEHFQVKITDFGIARLAESGGLTGTGAPIGTVTYMSPEQCRGEHVDGRSDIYSLGVVLYEVVTGYLPFQIDNFQDGLYKHINMQPPSPRLIRSDLPQHVEEIILRCLAKKPEERFQSGTALAHALAGLKDEEQLTIMTMPLHPQPKALESGQAWTVSTPVGESQIPTSIGKTIEQSALPPGVAVPPQVATLPGYEGKPRVRVLDQQGKNIHTVELTPKGLTIGRQPGCDIVLADNDISRQHLRISWDGQRVRIKDLDSGNGTFMNDVRLTPQVEQIWLEGQLLRIGSYWLRLEGLGQAPTVAGTYVSSPIHPPLPGSLGSPAVAGGIDQTVLKPESGTSSIGSPPIQTYGSYATTSSGGSRRIGLFTDSKTLLITPGQSALVRATITNLGQTVDWFTLTVEGVPQEWVRVPSEGVQLNPNMQETVDLIVNVARVPNNLAQDYPVVFRARSRQMPGESGSTRMTWTVQPFQDETLQIQPRRATGHGQATYTLTLQNLSNTRVNYQLSGDDDEQQISYGFRFNPITIEPDREVRVPLAVHTRRHFLGKEERLPFRVHARSAPVAGLSRPPLSTQGEFVNKPLLRTWIIAAALAVLLATSGVVLAFTGILPFGKNEAVQTTNYPATFTAIAQLSGVNAAQTAEAQHNATATAQAQNTNATASAQAQQGNANATASAQAQQGNANATATARANANAMATANANATATAKATPQTPVQISPANGSVFNNYPRTTTLVWQTVPNAITYTVQIDCFDCCQTGQWCTDVGQTGNIVANLTNPTYTFDFVGAQPGRWRVWAVYANSQAGPKSGWWGFSYTV